MLICIFTKLSFFFANDALRVLKKKFTSEIYIYLFTRFTQGHGKCSINRTSGFIGEAVLSLAGRCNKVESSCKVYACWKCMKTLSLSSVCSPPPPPPPPPVPLRGGGRGVSYPGPRGKRGAPRSLRKILFDNFSILTANVNPFYVSC